MDVMYSQGDLAVNEPFFEDLNHTELYMVSFLVVMPAWIQFLVWQYNWSNEEWTTFELGDTMTWHLESRSTWFRFGGISDAPLMSRDQNSPLKMQLQTTAGILLWYSVHPPSSIALTFIFWCLQQLFSKWSPGKSKGSCAKRNGPSFGNRDRTPLERMSAKWQTVPSSTAEAKYTRSYYKRKMVM